MHSSVHCYHLFDIPSSLSAAINQLFGLCTYHQSTSTNQSVYITVLIFSCFVTKYSDPNTEEGLFWLAVGFIWLHGESVNMGKGSHGSRSLRRLVRWHPQSGSGRHDCSYLLTFFSFFSPRSQSSTFKMDLPITTNLI